MIWGGYALGIGFVLLAVALFTVKFWSFLWYFAWWLEQHLIPSLYPDGLSYLKANTAAFLGSTYLIGGDFFLKGQILDFATTLMYIALPLIFSFMMGVVGKTKKIAAQCHRIGKPAPNIRLVGDPPPCHIILMHADALKEQRRPVRLDQRDHKENKCESAGAGRPGSAAFALAPVARLAHPMRWLLPT